MVVKSKQEVWHMKDLRGVFEVLRQHKLRLNAEKCAFRVGVGKFLGYLITNRGIEVNSDQINAVKRLKPPSNPKEVQVLTGMLAALNRFISKFADRCRPFYQLLKKWKGFQWDKECDKAFQDLKEYLMRAPMLTALEPGEDLLMYLSVFNHVIPAIGKASASLDTRHEKVAALFSSSHSICPNGVSPAIVVEEPRSSVKGQVLADFIAEFSPKIDGGIVCHVKAHQWKVFVDGASNALGAGAEIIIVTPEGIRLEHSFRLGFKASNNEAEYEAFLIGLRVVLEIGAQEVEIHSDSQLLVSQVQGTFEARDPWMKAYLQSAKEAMNKFSIVKVSQVGQTQNKHADSLATSVSSMTEEVPRLIEVELIAEPSIGMTGYVGIIKVDVAVITTPGPCWMDPIIEFLSEDRVPSDEKEANKVHRVAPRYWLSADRKLYRRSFGWPYLLCLHPEKVGELLAELHEGVYGNHVEGRSLAHRATTLGFWWP
ncbi:uncharacterized protein LOC112005501 [Quercus suber]|uniref:uncharacterized protein LOC112005501 n=1 Tax=Quercus suber TaxID=58331 RepID=UPI0032E04638